MRFLQLQLQGMYTEKLLLPVLQPTQLTLVQLRQPARRINGEVYLFNHGHRLRSDRLEVWLSYYYLHISNRLVGQGPFLGREKGILI